MSKKILNIGVLGAARILPNALLKPADKLENGMLCVEAFHYVYHPLMQRIKAIMDSDVLGEISHYEAAFCYPLISTKDIRFQYDLGGGATMDMGCYAINILRRLSGQEPTVKNAQATVPKDKQQIDRIMEAELIFPSGATGSIKSALRGLFMPSIKLNIIGELGEMKVINPFLPHLYHRIKVITEKKKWTEKIKSENNQTTYFYQLQSFADTILKNELKSRTGLEDAIKNMAVIDQVYLKAGLKKRGN